jgi:uncharacterized membrane protein
MSNLTVVIFDDEETAATLREAIRKGEEIDRITVEDSAVVVKDKDGELHVDHQVDRSVKIGAVGGSMLGLLLGSVFFPLAGLLTGAIGGALVGKVVSAGVERDFAQGVADAMNPGSSALFVVTRDSDPAYVRAMLRPYKGEIYHTTVDSEVEAEVREALRRSE